MITCFITTNLDHILDQIEDRLERGFEGFHQFIHGPFSFRSENTEERNNAAEAAKQTFDVIQNYLKHDVTRLLSS
jgi:hypothetical protein